MTEVLLEISMSRYRSGGWVVSSRCRMMHYFYGFQVKGEMTPRHAWWRCVGFTCTKRVLKKCMMLFELVMKSLFCLSPALPPLIFRASEWIRSRVVPSRGVDEQLAAFDLRSGCRTYFFNLHFHWPQLSKLMFLLLASAKRQHEVVIRYTAKEKNRCNFYLESVREKGSFSNSNLFQKMKAIFHLESVREK